MWPGVPRSVYRGIYPGSVPLPIPRVVDIQGSLPSSHHTQEVYTQQGPLPAHTLGGVYPAGSSTRTYPKVYIPSRALSPAHTSGCVYPAGLSTRTYLRVCIPSRVLYPHIQQGVPYPAYLPTTDQQGVPYPACLPNIPQGVYTRHTSLPYLRVCIPGMPPYLPERY